MSFFLEHFVAEVIVVSYNAIESDPHTCTKEPAKQYHRQGLRHFHCTTICLATCPTATSSTVEVVYVLRNTHGYLRENGPNTGLARALRLLGLFVSRDYHGGLNQCQFKTPGIIPGSRSMCKRELLGRVFLGPLCGLGIKRRLVFSELSRDVSLQGTVSGWIFKHLFVRAVHQT